MPPLRPPFAKPQQTGSQQEPAETTKRDLQSERNGRVHTAGALEHTKPDHYADISSTFLRTRYWDFEVLRPRDDLQAYLCEEFSVQRLNDVYDWLWWAGRRVPPRGLHRTRMMGRSIVVTEQTDLHLVRTDDTVFVKPLPDYLLKYQFWSEYICSNDELHQTVRGFLQSYIWLVRNRSDFKIAQDEWLLPEGLTWSSWNDFVDRFWQVSGIDGYQSSTISQRYHYGELRLSRLNQIYRFAPRFGLRHLRSGYFSTYSTYSSFFSRHFAWLILAFAYLSIILSAMQVGLGTSQLNADVAFERASYGFAVASIVLPLAAAVLALALYVGLWVYHVSTTWLAWERIRRREVQDAGEKNNTSGRVDVVASAP